MKYVINIHTKCTCAKLKIALKMYMYLYNNQTYLYLTWKKALFYKKNYKKI